MGCFHHIGFCDLFQVGRTGDEESQEDVLMDEAPSNMSQASTLQANREGGTGFCKSMNMHHSMCLNLHLAFVCGIKVNKIFLLIGLIGRDMVKYKIILAAELFRPL